MKRGEIKDKYPQMDITINSREASRLLWDLEFTSKHKELMPESKQLVKYLKELGGCGKNE